MPRPFFPHTLQDVIHAVDGPFGLIVADMPDGVLWVLKYKKRQGHYVLTQYADKSRKTVVSSEKIVDRTQAINVFSDRIVLGERL